MWRLNVTAAAHTEQSGDVECSVTVCGYLVFMPHINHIQLTIVITLDTWYSLPNNPLLDQKYPEILKAKPCNKNEETYSSMFGKLHNITHNHAMSA